MILKGKAEFNQDSNYAIIENILFRVDI